MTLDGPYVRHFGMVVAKCLPFCAPIICPFRKDPSGSMRANITTEPSMK